MRIFFTLLFFINIPGLFAQNNCKDIEISKHYIRGEFASLTDTLIFFPLGDDIPYPYNHTTFTQSKNNFIILYWEGEGLVSPAIYKKKFRFRKTDILIILKLGRSKRKYECLILYDDIFMLKGK